MNIHHHSLPGKALAAVLLLAAPLTATQAKDGKARTATVKQDNSYRTGRLKNGLTYYLRRNAKEPGLADFYLAQRVGSILEEPRQRGLAHFLEHMAFNGTEHFQGTPQSPGIRPWCESIGVKFGANLNAYTSVDQTVYNISAVPLRRAGILDSTLLILHDWSHSLLLSDEEIDKERGVIHEEWRTRQSSRATQRMTELLMPVIYQGTKYEDCLPIGSMDIVDHFPYQDLRDYYQKWYRPDLQAVIVVGDIDVDQVERKLKHLFGPIPRARKAAERVYYPVNDNDTLIVAATRDSEQPIMLATLYMKHDPVPDRDKVLTAYQQEDYLGRLVISMLNERLQDMQHTAQPPCLSASAREGAFFVSRTKDAFALSFGCRQENIRGSFEAAIGQAERAHREGFSAEELSRAKARLLAQAERQYAERDDRKNSHYVGRALRHFLAGEPLLSAGESLDMTRRLDSETTLEQVNETARDLISDQNQVLVVYAPDKPDFNLPSREELRRYVEETQQKADEATGGKKACAHCQGGGHHRDGHCGQCDDTGCDTADAELPTLDLSVPATEHGTITATRDYGRHGVTELTLSNGIKVYHKPTAFAKDEVRVRLFAENGTNLLADEAVPDFAFLSSAITDAGVAQYDQPTLRKALAGKLVRLTPSVSDDLRQLTGASSVKDAETLFQLLHAYFAQPRRDSVAFGGTMDRMRSFLTHREANPQVAYNDSLLSLVYGNHPRKQPTKKETLERVDYDRIYNSYRQLFSDPSQFRMTVIGNLPADTLRPLLERYVASLKGTAAPEPAPHEAPQVVGGDFTRLLHKPMNTPCALVTILYTFDQPVTPKADLTLDYLKRTLQIAYTDSVREEKGGTYGVSVDFDLDPDSQPAAMLKIGFRTDPSRYEELIPLIYRQLSHMAAHGPNEADLEKARQFLHKNYQQNVLDNGYWDYVLTNELRHGLDFDTGYTDLVDAITATDVQQAAQALLDSHRRIELTMLPAEE